MAKHRIELTKEELYKLLAEALKIREISYAGWSGFMDCGVFIVEYQEGIKW
jgi:hypothetical protein